MAFQGARRTHVVILSAAKNLAVAVALLPLLLLLFNPKSVAVLCGFA